MVSVTSGSMLKSRTLLLAVSVTLRLPPLSTTLWLIVIVFVRTMVPSQEKITWSLLLFNRAASRVTELKQPEALSEQARGGENKSSTHTDARRRESSRSVKIIGEIKYFITASSLIKKPFALIDFLAGFFLLFAQVLLKLLFARIFLLFALQGILLHQVSDFLILKSLLVFRIIRFELFVLPALIAERFTLGRSDARQFCFFDPGDHGGGLRSRQDSRADQ